MRVVVLRALGDLLDLAELRGFVVEPVVLDRNVIDIGRNTLEPLGDAVA
jgi:hypothetical protein